MAPIRVALVGLSPNSISSWAATAHLPYLISTRGKAHYEIAALCNSSKKAAEAAVKHFNLPPTTKTYGDPASLAADPDIDLVVCSVRVDSHFPAIQPSIQAGKPVYVEWPLAESLDRALELTADKQLKDSIIGLQQQCSPLALAIKQELASGRIGKVLNSNVVNFNKLTQEYTLTEGISYLADRKVGGNGISIIYAHLIDMVHSVLGEFENFDSRSQIQFPTATVFDKDGKPTRTLDTDVPDFLVAHGRLAKNSLNNIADDAILSVTWKNSQPFKGSPAFIWTITGETGQIKASSEQPFVNAILGGLPIKVEVHDYASDEVSEIPCEFPEWQKELPARARSVAELYERYARWVEGGKKNEVEEGGAWSRLHDAVRRHREIQEVFDHFDAKK